MKVSLYLKKGTEYTIDKITIENSGSSIKTYENPEVLWDSDTEMLHLCLDYESETVVDKINLIDSDNFTLVSLENVTLIPGNNLFQILLSGYLIKNSPSKDTTELISEIEKITTLENIPERDEYKSKYLNSLGGNPLGAFNKFGERIYQQHTEKLIESINVNIPESITSGETTLPLIGTYTYHLRYIENGEIKKEEELETERLEGSGATVSIISAPEGTEFKYGNLYIPENESADKGRIIQGSIKLGNIQEVFTIYQERAKLTYETKYYTDFKKDNTPIFVLSGTGGKGLITINNLNTDLDSLEYYFPYPDLFSYEVEKGTNSVSITVQTVDINYTNNYVPNVPEIFEIKTKDKVTIASFYVVQGVRSTSSGFGVCTPNGTDYSLTEVVAGKKVDFVVYYKSTSTTTPRYWTASILSDRGSGEIIKDKKVVKEGICYPTESSQTFYQYIYSIQTNSSFSEVERKIGTVTFISPNTGQSALNLSWENVALSDTLTLDLIEKEGEDIFLVDNTLSVTGLGVYNLEITTNKTLTVHLDSNVISFEDGSKIKTLKLSNQVGQGETFILPIRYFGPTPFSGIIPSEDLGEIDIYKGYLASGDRRATVNIESNRVDNFGITVEEKNLEEIGLDDSSTLFLRYLQSTETVTWKLVLRSKARIEGYNVVFDWDDLDENGSPAQIITRSVTGFSGGSAAAGYKIFELNPSYYDSTIKVLSEPIVIIQIGSPPVFVKRRPTLDNPEVEEITKLKVNLNYRQDNNHTSYLNDLDNNQILYDPLCYCKYLGVEYSVDALYDTDHPYNNVNIGNSANGFRGIKFTSNPFILNGDQGSTYKLVGTLTITNKQEIKWSVVNNITGSSLSKSRLITSKTLTVEFWGGEPVASVVGDDVIYSGNTNSYNIENIDSTKWTIDSINFPNPYRGIKLRNDDSSGLSFRITSYYPIYPSRPDNTEGTEDWRLFRNYEVEADVEKGYDDYLFSEPDEITINLKGIEDPSLTSLIKFTLEKRSFRGHFTIDESIYGPVYDETIGSGGIIDSDNKPIDPNINWNTTYIKRVSWDTTYVEIGYICTLYEADDSTTTRSGTYYLSLTENRNINNTKETTALIEVDRAKLPIKIIQERYTYEFEIEGANGSLFKACGGEGVVLKALTDIRLEDFIIRERDTNGQLGSEDVQDNFFMSKKNGELTIDSFVDKNIGAFKRLRYGLYINTENDGGVTELQHLTDFYISQEGIEVILISPDGQYSDIGLVPEHPLEVGAAEEDGSATNHRFPFTAIKHIDGSMYDTTTISEDITEKMVIKSYSWECTVDGETEVIPAEQIFERHSTEIAHIQGDNNYYIYNLYKTRTEYLSKTVSISALVEVEFEDDNDAANYSRELIMYLEKGNQ